MPYQNLCAVVLAAGASTRFSQTKSKLCHVLAGQEMILYPLKSLEALGIKKTFVLGHQREAVSKVLIEHANSHISFSYQNKQLGTGHALASSAEHWCRSHILVINGDMPFVDSKLLEEFIKKYSEVDSDLFFLTFKAKNPNGYGRVLLKNDRPFIVEEKDCTPQERALTLVNAGVYIFKKDFLTSYIYKLSNTNASGEFYLTDLVNMASQDKLSVETFETDQAHAFGVNTLEQLLEAEEMIVAQKQDKDSGFLPMQK